MAIASKLYETQLAFLFNFYLFSNEADTSVNVFNTSCKGI